MSEGTQRRLAAIVSADVVGYSRLMGVDETGTLASMKAHRRELWTPIIQRFGGRIVGSAGDSILVEFASAVAAVESSVAVQNGMAERNAELPDKMRMLLRIGINIGEVIIDGEDIYGDGVNIAARMQEVSEPGGIAISGNVEEQIRDKLELTFADDGMHEVKNIAQPVHVWRWSLDESGTTSPSDGASLPLPDKPSIAVLPFDNMSDDPQQEYFADGLTEDIITDLSRFQTFFVIARHSAFVYKGKPVTVQDVGRELGVHYVVEGSVRKAGDRLRVVVQLVESNSGNHIWAERYDNDLIDIFDPTEECSVAEYVQLAHRKIDEIRQRGKEVVFVGGSSLYLKALLRGIYQGPPADWQFRKDVEAEVERVGVEALHRRLQQVDPLAAAKLHPNDKRRIIRALEVYRVTGTPLSHQQTQFEEGRPADECRVFVLSWPRDVLHQRINDRVERMFSARIVDEVRGLLSKFGGLGRTASQAVGYCEVIEHLSGERSLDDTIESVKTRTRQFARRQETWFRSLSECRRIELTAESEPSDIATKIVTLGTSATI